MLVTETPLLQVSAEICVGKKIDLKIACASLPVRIKQMILNLVACDLHAAARTAIGIAGNANSKSAGLSLAYFFS